MDLQASVQKWVKALSKPEQYFIGAVVENQEEILDLNISQLEVGKDSLGELLERYALDVYAEFKQAIGSQAPFGVPDLKLEGDFHSGFVLIVDGKEIRITSTDDKTDDLEFKYGEDIFGLMEDSMDKIRPALLQSWLNQLRNEL